MKDITKLLKNQTQAKGKVKIELTDPITNKVKERIEGENHVFTDSLFSNAWIDNVSAAYLLMQDYTGDVDITIPYLLGQTVGFGMPGTGSSGAYRGAATIYEERAIMSLDSVRWKFQYEFGPTQANDTIGTLGLTRQIYQVASPYKAFNPPVYVYYSYTNDGRYMYSYMTTGIMTKHDILLGTDVSIDLTAYTATYGNIGFDPTTGKYYLWVSSSTPANRLLYEFSDNTFSELLNTYSLSNVTLGNDTYYALYVYGGQAFFFQGNGSAIYKIDFINNTNYISISTSAMYNQAFTSSAYTSGYLKKTCPLKGTLIMTQDANANRLKGLIFDLSSSDPVGYVFGNGNNIADNTASYKFPFSTENIICHTSTGANDYHNAAITAYKLETPVTKTDANGMTVTYELEVFW